MNIFKKKPKPRVELTEEQERMLDAAMWKHFGVVPSPTARKELS